MRRRRGMSIELKTPAQLALMREAGLVVAAALQATAQAAEPGISTAELDQIAAQVIREAGATPSFLGYHGYPATICTSVNDQIVHGIPGSAAVLAAGDVLSIDCGAIVGGWHGDAALTIVVGPGPVPEQVAGLLAACEQALWQGLSRAVPGGRLTDIGAAVEAAARSAGPFGVVEDYTGHGIGTQMHMDPPVPNYGPPGRGPVLTEGMALAVEPMLVLGDAQTRLLDDDWTVVTEDGSLAAHFEHTVAITADGPWVLTAADGGVSGLAGGRMAASAAAATAPGPAGPAAPGGRCPLVRGGVRGNPEMVADPRIRASDDDRDKTASLLREHHAAGRLTPEEFNERLDKTFAAKTLGDLDELMSDLPAIDLYRLPHSGLATGSAGHLPAPVAAGDPARPGRFSPGWQAAWGSWFSVSAVLVVLWVLTNAGSPWFLWIVAPWGLILLGRWISGGHPDGNHPGQHNQHGLHDRPPGELPGDQGGSPGEDGPGGPDGGSPRQGR